MLHSSVLSAQGIQEVEPPELPARGSFEVRKEGGLSGVEVGLARFEPDKKQEVDGQPAFVVALHTGAIEGGIFLAFGGEQRPAAAQYELVRSIVARTNDTKSFRSTIPPCCSTKRSCSATRGSLS